MLTNPFIAFSTSSFNASSFLTTSCQQSAISKSNREYAVCTKIFYYLLLTMFSFRRQLSAMSYEPFYLVKFASLRQILSMMSSINEGSVLKLFTSIAKASLSPSRVVT